MHFSVGMGCASSRSSLPITASARRAVTETPLSEKQAKSNGRMGSPRRQRRAKDKLFSDAAPETPTNPLESAGAKEEVQEELPGVEVRTDRDSAANTTDPAQSDDPDALTRAA